MEWRDDQGEETALPGASTAEWDLEDALARAILGDVDDLCITTTTASMATVSLRDEAEEERLIERLHARLFPDKTTSTIKKTRQVHSRQVKSNERPRVVKQTTKSPPPAQPQRSLSPEKIDQMVARFRLHEAKRARKLAALKHQSSAISVVSSTPSDLVTPRSRELTRSLPGFQERQAIARVTSERERERRRHYDEQQQHHLRDALTRAIRTPCICSSGHGSSNGAGETHSPACMRFMDACEKRNTSSERRDKLPTVRRSVDDLLQFHEETKLKVIQMAETQRRMEDQKTTFAPKINKHSIQIYEDMVESGRLARANSPPLPPTQPPLCAQSKRVLTTSTKRRSSITSRSSTRSKCSIWTSRRRPSHSQLVPAFAFSESHYAKQAAAVAHKDTPPSSPQPPPLVVPWTNVAYDSPNCDFILTSFDQPAWFR